jgi:hypothetical protein
MWRVVVALLLLMAGCGRDVVAPVQEPEPISGTYDIEFTFDPAYAGSTAVAEVTIVESGGILSYRFFDGVVVIGGAATSLRQDPATALSGSEISFRVTAGPTGNPFQWTFTGDATDGVIEGRFALSPSGGLGSFTAVKR